MIAHAYLRIPLSEAEAHRAELAATKAALADALARVAAFEAKEAKEKRRRDEADARAIAAMETLCPECGGAGVFGQMHEDKGGGICPQWDTRPHVATRRDAHGRRWWDGVAWVLGGVADALARTLDAWAFVGKPRGSRLVALDDVPALLAEDAAKDAAK